MANARPEAAAQLEEACRLNPDCDLRVRLAEMYLDMGRTNDALHCVDQALKKNLRLAAAWRVRGRAFRAVGDEPWLPAIATRPARLCPGPERPAPRGRLRCHRPSNDRRNGGRLSRPGPAATGVGNHAGLAETYSPDEEPQQVLYLTGLDYMALQRYDDAAASLSTAMTRGRPTSELLYCLARRSIKADMLRTPPTRCNGHWSSIRSIFLAGSCWARSKSPGRAGRWN